MSQESRPINEHDAASQSLIAVATKVNKSLGDFSGWLIAGVGVAFSLLVANVEKISQFICVYYVRTALLLLLISLVISVVAKLLSAMVSASLGAYKAGVAIGKKITDSGRLFDVNVFITEFERGLFLYQRWLTKKSMAKVKAGDAVAGARMIAKLSQVQAMLVFTEALLVIVAAGMLVAGLKIQ